MASRRNDRTAPPGGGPFVVVGQFAGAHGVRGEFKLRSFTEEPRDVAAYGPLRTDDARILTVALVREAKPGLFVARAPEIRTREDCDAYAGRTLSVPRAALPPPEEDAFYLSDLVGLAARTPEGAPAGRVKAVVNHGAGDLIELSSVPGRRGIVVVGFTRDDVPTVDVPGGTLTVVLPEKDDTEGAGAPPEGEAGAGAD